EARNAAHHFQRGRRGRPHRRPARPRRYKTGRQGDRETRRQEYQRAAEIKRSLVSLLVSSSGCEMVSRFFIDRPIFATVLSLVITLVGGIALYYLPISQYPRITPPGVTISIAYPGASAQVVADTVAAPIEQQVNGVEGMLYMSSQMGNDGTYALTVTFDV